ncbi:MAG: single-stranded DNA-binding protein [Candidatus Babeliaceae bacterium]|jgi:single-strand DNA-binding protein
MAGYNRIIMIGNLTRDPEFKQLPSGQGLCKLGLASNRPFKNKQTGLLTQEVCFVDVDVWGPQAESCHKYLQKGRPVLIEGRLKLDSWKDDAGQNRSKHSIVADRVVFLAAGQSAEIGDSESITDESFNVGQNNNRSKDYARPAQSGAGVFKDEAPFEDDLPF